MTFKQANRKIAGVRVHHCLRRPCYYAAPQISKNINAWFALLWSVTKGGGGRGKFVVDNWKQKMSNTPRYVTSSIQI